MVNPMDKTDEQTIARGGAMRSVHVFETLRGDKVSNVKGGCPKEGQLLEGPYPCQSHSTLWLPTCCERLHALSNPCWTLPVSCSLVHRGRIESTINLYPAKGKAMVMSATTTSLEWPD